MGLDFSQFGEVVDVKPTVEPGVVNPERMESLPVRGDTGDAVVRLQQSLVDRGVTVVGEVDGAFGANTEKGIQEFQELTGLPRTGVMDEATSKALFDTPIQFDEEGAVTVQALDFSQFGEALETEEPSEPETFSFDNTVPRLFNDLKRDFGFTDEQAAAFVGNLAVETDQFRTLQEYKPVVKGSRGGYGFAQWTGPRRVAYEKFAKENNLDPSSYEANYAYLKQELTTSMPETIGNIGLNTTERLKGKADVATASDFVADYFLRPGVPHKDKRREASQRVLSLIKGQETDD